MIKASLLSGVIIVFITETVSAQDLSGRVQVSGNLKGLNGDSVVLYTWEYNAVSRVNRADTFYMVTKMDAVSFTGNLSTDRTARLVIGGLNGRSGTDFFLQPGDIRIQGDIKEPEKIQISGTKDNDDYTRHRIAEQEVYALNTPLLDELRKLQASANPDSISIGRLSRQIATNRDKVRKLRHAFIQEHPSSLASLNYLRVLEDNLPLEEFERLYNAFTPRLKETLAGQELKDKLNARNNTALGKSAPLFTSKDVQGKLVNLSDFRGKYVLLEFWASWCVPCREEHPHLSGVYEKYRDKGFTIVQYSIDERSAIEKWKEAIKKDRLIWPQLSDLAGFRSPVAKLYGVQPIPDNFLIDPSGVIIGRRLRGKALEQKLAEIFN